MLYTNFDGELVIHINVADSTQVFSEFEGCTC